MTTFLAAVFGSHYEQPASPPATFVATPASPTSTAPPMTSPGSIRPESPRSSNFASPCGSPMSPGRWSTWPTKSPAVDTSMMSGSLRSPPATTSSLRSPPAAAPTTDRSAATFTATTTTATGMGGVVSNSPQSGGRLVPATVVAPAVYCQMPNVPASPALLRQQGSPLSTTYGFADEAPGTQMMTPRTRPSPTQTSLSFSAKAWPTSSLDCTAARAADSGACQTLQRSPVQKEDPATAKLRKIFARIDANSDGIISRLDFLNAVEADSEVAECVLPGRRVNELMQDEAAFDAAEEAFEAMSMGRSRVRFENFAAHLQSPSKAPGEEELRAAFDRIDALGAGSISKLELVSAMQNHAAIRELLAPGVDGGSVMEDEGSYELITGVFQAMASGRRRIDYNEFQSYFRRIVGPGGIVCLGQRTCARPQASRLREGTRVLVLGPRQGRGLEAAGYQVRYCGGPDIETPGLHVATYVPQIKADIDNFQPDVVMSCSFGGAYISMLWQLGYWRGPTVMLNAHPSCRVLPVETPVVIAHGSNDERYSQTRDTLEHLMQTGGPNKTFLLYTANSGRQTTGHYSRVGDRHSLDSLQHHDCVPRLIDASLDSEGPEMHFLRTCRDRLQELRLDAESKIGYTPEAVRKSWVSAGRTGAELVDVPPNSAEFRLVTTMFKAQPNERAIYQLKPQHVWDATQAVRVQRVENGFQQEGSAKPYFESLRTSIECQGTSFEPGTHTCWGFHGASREAMESIVHDPLAGFQPLASGTKKASLWGSGTYFAREARYVAEGGFCAEPAADGTQQMLMCLLMIGIPCLGSPEHHGVLPYRQKPHRYNSSVDCLASPEVFIIQHPGAAYPAYIITFVAPPS